MRHETTQGVSLEVQAPLKATLRIEVKGQLYRYRLSELIRRARSHFLRGWLSEAIRIGPLTPLPDCCFTTELSDTPTNETDQYQLNVSQRNSQWAWLTPIWVRQ